ncbi:helix-hairpin-helix domain-containing protein [Nosocomiicoccus ampullae]|uniref:Competence protein ComEA n=1 Tax=Nosocomiicoccus ampullae TaxID=489910 RepID=A0A9Q2D116_9STAP|nr:helix-hairpin-helix domain-containing protein [Nosocomiicoccus ampullae]MBB5176552.1 competence protein ComEA [Nosocomiicoccus ampullae]QYA47530.1 helix-hairpin-helix domain-containing protein [Nosocomiicoccus ampullae]
MAELFFKYKTILLSSVLGILCIFLIAIFFKTTDDIEYTEPVEVNNSVSANEEIEEVIDNAYIYVEIKGAVKHSDVYKISKDARIKDLIILGDPLPNADLNSINQSEKLHDEKSVYVPVKGEVVDVKESETSDKIVVNINTATKDELMRLNGVGEKKAETIIEYREENGLFNKKEDLMNIPGIGQKTFENLQEHIEI